MVENNQVNERDPFCVEHQVHHGEYASERLSCVKTVKASTARAAILDVIDEGQFHGSGKYPWVFRIADTPENNEARTLFADRVQARIEELERVNLS